MADSAQERTEQPTHERLRKARDEGQIPQSQELPSALAVGILLLTLGMTAASLYDWFVGEMHAGLSLRQVRTLDLDAFGYLVKSKASGALAVVMPFMIAGVVVSVLSGVLMGGWSLSPHATQMKFSRLNPIAGFKNLISTKSLASMITSLVKLAVLLGIIWVYMHDRVRELLVLHHASAVQTLEVMCRLIFGLVARLTIGVVAIALADMIYQKWQYKRSLRMTKEEVRQERKNQEMPSTIKGRMRSVQFEMARKRMLQEVPKADVVVVNPTHVAVALRYEAGRAGAPMVVAKGADFMCEKIKEIARAHSVPIVQRPELARAIYGACDLNEPIPETLFIAVAEVLAMVYRMKNRKSGSRNG